MKDASCGGDFVEGGGAGGGGALGLVRQGLYAGAPCPLARLSFILVTSDLVSRC